MEKVTVNPEKLKQCLLKMGYTSDNIEKGIATQLRILPQVVSVELQPELDYYLENQQLLKPSNHTDEIERIMKQNTCRFFDALTMYSKGVRAV